VPTASGERSDTPLSTFLETFAYCAIVEASISEPAAEIVVETPGCDVKPEHSALMVMTPRATGRTTPVTQLRLVLLQPES